MFDFELAKVIDPTQFTMTLTESQFRNTYLPAYCDSWVEAFEFLTTNIPDKNIVRRLLYEYGTNGGFDEDVKVQLPMCDLDDQFEYPASVANGMHRTTAYHLAKSDITFKFFYPFLPEEDVFTEVELVFANDIDEDDVTLFEWLRSLPLDNGEWVESMIGSNSANRYNVSLDRVVDHRVLLKKMHELGTMDEFNRYGLVEIHINDVRFDDED